jgi:branched-chain amino acid transport system ATP-binding protein
MLQVENLRAQYGDTEVLHDVSLSCESGQVVCLLGRNGAGKSTTLKSLMGLLRASDGSISLSGESIAGRAPFEIARLGVGFVPEERLIFPSLTVDENLAMGQWRGKSATSRETRDRVLDMFPRLKDKIASRGRTLSGGEQQMLAIGRALMAVPKVLLVDEPTEGLAPVVVQSLERTLRQLADEGTAILVAESKLAVARRIADRISVIGKGKTVFHGSPEQLEESVGVRRQYLEV